MSHDRYAGRIIRWVDGDTVEMSGMRSETTVAVQESFGMEVTTTTTITTRKTDTYRLTIVDTPERGQPGYREATDYCNKVLPPGTYIEFITHGVDDGGWGRTLADVLIPGEGTTTMSSLLLRDGFAKVWEPR